MEKIKRQTGTVWLDKEQKKVDRSRITEAEQLREKFAVNIFNAAIIANNALQKVKDLCKVGAEKCYFEFLKESGEFIGDKLKITTHTYYSFDHCIKIQHEVVAEIAYDENNMFLAKDQFKAFIDGRLTDNQKFIKSLILSAFQNVKGKFDHKKINSLLKFRMDPSVVKDKLFLKACTTLESAKMEVGKNYYDRIFVKNGKKWDLVNLQFSGIRPTNELGEKTLIGGKKESEVSDGK